MESVRSTDCQKQVSPFRQNKAMSLLALLTFVTFAGAEVGQGEGTDPSKIERARKGFLELSRPIQYKFVVGTNEPLESFVLSGETRKYAEKYDGETLIYALWGFLDDEARAGEAVVVLDAKLKSDISGEWGGTDWLTSKDARLQEAARRLIRLCRHSCCQFLGKDDEWYPHEELFDEERVLVESRTNDVVRAKYIAQMKKALADEEIRTGNPIGCPVGVRP